MAMIIIVVVSAFFVLTGTETFLTGGNSAVGEINGEEISEGELQEAMQLQKRRLLSSMKDQVDSSLLADEKIRPQAIDALVRQKLLSQSAEANNMTISDIEVTRAIKKHPDFQEDGKFSKPLFETLLARNGMSANMFMRLYKGDLLLNQYTSGYINSGFVTDKDLAINARFMEQKRDLRYVTLDKEQERKQIDASEEELKAYYDDNNDEFKTQESVVVEYIELNKSDYDIEVTEEDIQQAYAQELEGFEGGETKEIAHILIETDNDTTEEQAKATLNDIKAKVEAGESFADLAKQFSDDLGSKEFGGQLGELVEGAPEVFFEATNGVGLNEVSAVVETDDGFHIIQVTGITTIEAPTLEERRDVLAAEIKTAKIEPVYQSALEQLRELASETEDLQEPSEQLEMTVKTASGVTRAGGEGLFSNPKVLSALYSEQVYDNNENSDLIELSSDQAVVARIQEVIPSVVQSFDDVKEQVRAAVISKKADEALAKKAGTVLEAVQKGADIETLANENKYEWQVQLATTRNKGGVDKEILDAAFKLPKAGEDQRAVDQITLPNGNIVIMAVNNVLDGEVAATPGLDNDIIRSYMGRSKSVEQFQTLQKSIKDRAEIDLL